jgi:glyoxylase-like metal-dependent hydrolase (beta-lactamase superfamily II)
MFGTSSTIKLVTASSVALFALLAGCATQAGDETASNENQVHTGGTDPGTGAAPPPGAVTEADAELPAEWPNHGSASCSNHHNDEPTIYKFKYNADTYILRENKCFNFEANFIYLIFGQDKVLMLDTGSVPSGYTKPKFTAEFPIHDTVEGIIGEWLAAHPNADGSARTRDSIELLVTHTHSHGDHVSGDYQFKNTDGSPLPNTKVAGLRPSDVATFFGLQNWPNQGGSVDLGGRTLDVLPIPGHESAHIALYDAKTQILLTGDTLYPGHIFIQDWTAFRASTKRLSAWVHETDAAGKPLRPIKYVLGTHIEKKPTTGAASFYPYPSWIQDPERKLDLTAAHVDFEAQQAQSLGPNVPSREVFFDDFSIDPRSSRPPIARWPGVFTWSARSQLRDVEAARAAGARPLAAHLVADDRGGEGERERAADAVDLNVPGARDGVAAHGRRARRGGALAERALERAVAEVADLEAVHLRGGREAAARARHRVLEVALVVEGAAAVRLRVRVGARPRARERDEARRDRARLRERRRARRRARAVAAGPAGEDRAVLRLRRERDLRARGEAARARLAAARDAGRVRRDRARAVARRVDGQRLLRRRRGQLRRAGVVVVVVRAGGVVIVVVVRVVRAVRERAIAVIAVAADRRRRTADHRRHHRREQEDEKRAHAHHEATAVPARPSI